MAYQSQDALNVLYNAISTPLTADGSSSEVDFDVDGGCFPSEIVLSVSDIETGESIVFNINSYESGSFVDTAYKLHVTEDGEYIWPIDNRVVPGSKLKLDHDITLDTSSLDGIKVHAHVRPRTL
jgi:hypothetical protein